MARLRGQKAWLHISIQPRYNAWLVTAKRKILSMQIILLGAMVLFGFSSIAYCDYKGEISVLTTRMQELVGALPLSVLDANIKAWVRTKKAE